MMGYPLGRDLSREADRPRSIEAFSELKAVNILIVTLIGFIFSCTRVRVTSVWAYV